MVLRLKRNERNGGEKLAITLKAARVNAGMTQKNAAKALEITTTTLVNYEAGRSIPKIDMAQKMANLYKTTLEDINFFAT